MLPIPMSFFILAVILLMMATAVFTPYLLLWASAFGLAGFMAWLFPSTSMLWTGVIAIVAGLLFTAGYLRSRNNTHLADLRPKQFIGETFRLTHPIKKGCGKICLHKATWALQCHEDLPVHTPVRIINTSGAVLIVEKHIASM